MEDLHLLGVLEKLFQYAGRPQREIALSSMRDSLIRRGICEPNCRCGRYVPCASSLCLMCRVGR